jgi:FAD/FMN-containing dehydrogenase
MTPAQAALPSWGRYPKPPTSRVVAPWWRDEPLPAHAPLLARGCGRSYGDSCLNGGGTLVETARLDRIIAFDREAGVIRCEAGTTLEQVLALAVPAGWFLPVTPGTRFVTLGGAIANDVHGKNHHRAGTFGAHVRRFELARSDGSRTECSRSDSPELFAATIGGLGLTGLVTWAEIALRPIRSSYLACESIRFAGLDAFFGLSDESNEHFEHTVAWIDTTARAAPRGIFMRANHVEEDDGSLAKPMPRPRMAVPFDCPAGLLNRASVAAFNALYYRASREGASRAHFVPFFYPLDALARWNRLYGRRGFVQHQCVVPTPGAREGTEELLREVARAREAPFLAVLKVFGDRSSPGLLSFPRPGATLAMDLPMRGEPTLRLLERLDAIVRAHGGAVYPAKDARMSPATFAAGFPRLAQFEAWVDPAFSSDFWRRVRGHG